MLYHRVELTLYQTAEFRLAQTESICRQIKCYSKFKVVFHRTENIVGKEENAGYQHFPLFPQCFQKAFSSSASKAVIVWYRVKHLPNDKILTLPKLKAFADDNFMVAQIYRAKHHSSVGSLQVQLNIIDESAIFEHVKKTVNL